MAKIDSELLAKLEKKLKVSQRQVYNLIDKKVRQNYVSREQAAIMLAADCGINISRYSSQFSGLRGNKVTGNGDQQAGASNLAVAFRPSRVRGKRKAVSPRRRGTSVFVVHGRDETLRREFFGFLRSIGLEPIEWRQAIAMTKKGSPYIGQILDAAFHEASAVVVLLSPDDLAQLNPKFLKKGDAKYERKLTGQARPNVLFEAGMAMGRNPDSTVLVQIGELRPFSDVAGRHAVHLTNSAESRTELATKLSNAGCSVDTSGTDWLREGKF